MRGSIAIAVALAATMAAGGVRAQAFAPPPVVPVEIQGSEVGSSIEVIIQGREFQCGQKCALTLPPGAYNLRVTDADGNLSRENLYVRAPTRAIVTPANRSARITGIVLMTAAVVGAAIGAFGFFAIGRTDDRCTFLSDCDQKTGRWMYASAIGAGAAVVFGFTGFHLWDQNRTAGIKLVPLEDR